MAYEFDPRLSDEENKNLAAQQGQRTVGGSLGGDAGGVLPAGGQPSNTSGASGSFTNLQRYITENQPQAVNLAGKVASQVTSAGQEAKTAEEGAAQAATQQVNAGRVAMDPSLLEEASKNPQGIVSDQAKSAAFARELGGNYGGPKSFEETPGFQTAQDKMQQAQQKIGAADTEEGRMSLLSTLSPGQGRGKTSLDQLLLSGNPEAGQTIQAAAKPYAGLQDYLQQQSDQIKQQAAQAATEAGETNKAVQDRFLGQGGVVPTAASALADKVTAAQKAAQDRATAVKGDLTGMNPTDQDLADLGMIREQFNSIKAYQDVSGDQAKIDPLAYLTTRNPAAEFTLANTATPEDYAKQAALQQLLGPNATLGLSAAEAAKAGTAPKSILNYDVGGAQGGAKTSLQAFMSQKPPIMAQNGLAVGQAPSLKEMASGNFYDALVNMANIANVPNMTMATSAQKVDAQRFISTPIFQALYKAAQDARANQAPHTSPDSLMNHLPPEIAAMLR